MTSMMSDYKALQTYVYEPVLQIMFSENGFSPQIIMSQENM